MVKEKRVVKRYAMEFKIDAVKLVLEQGYSVVEATQRLGISDKSLYKWKEPYLEGRLVASYKRAQSTVEEAELRKVKEENKRLKMEMKS